MTIEMVNDNKVVDVDVLESLAGNLENLIEFIEQAPTKMKELSEELSLVDLELVDIYHYIENVSFNAAEGYFLCKELQNVLLKRRDIKAEHSKLQVALSSFSSLIKKENLNRLHKNIEKNIEKQENPIYTPRVRVDLFERIKNKSNVKINIL